MRRRLATLLSAALLGLAVLGPVAPAAAADTVVLATEAGEGGEAPGLEPKSADASDNEFAPDQYEANWTATLAGRALFALILLIAIAIGVGYYVRVARFSRSQRQS